MTYNVGDLVSEFLYQNGVKNVFGVVSVHNIPMLDAIGRRNFLEWFQLGVKWERVIWPMDMQEQPMV